MSYSIDDFYVGQKVKIKEWDDMVSEYGTNQDGDIASPIEVFPKAWKHRCGRAGVITTIDKHGKHSIEINTKGSFYGGLFHTDLIPLEESNWKPSFDAHQFKNMLGVVDR